MKREMARLPRITIANTWLNMLACWTVRSLLISMIPILCFHFYADIIRFWDLGYGQGGTYTAPNGFGWELRVIGFVNGRIHDLLYIALFLIARRGSYNDNIPTL